MVTTTFKRIAARPLMALALSLASTLALPLACHAQDMAPPPTQQEKRVYERIGQLQAKLNAQQARIDALEAKLATQQKALDQAMALITAKPKGYTKAFITIGNLSHLPPTDGISYWARE